ncbi:hypothetical protein ACFLX5_05950 [Chloroflexota bacterium]
MEHGAEGNPGQDRIKEGEFREWYFPAEEILEWARTFLQTAGYELLPPSHIGFVSPDIHARKKSEKGSHQIVGVVSQHFDVALEGLAKLSAIRSVLSDDADYVLVLPPVSEFLMLEFFRSENGRWYREIKHQSFMVWLANPDEEFVWCIIGGPQDRALEGNFAFGTGGVDAMLAMGELGILPLSPEELEDY